MSFDVGVKAAFSDCSPHLALAVVLMLSIYGCLTNSQNSVAHLCSCRGSLGSTGQFFWLSDISPVVRQPLGLGFWRSTWIQGYKALCFQGLSSRAAELLMWCWLRPLKKHNGRSVQAFQRLRPGTTPGLLPLLGKKSWGPEQIQGEGSKLHLLMGLAGISVTLQCQLDALQLNSMLTLKT